MTNIKKRINLKVILFFLAASISFISLNGGNIAKAADPPEPDVVTVPAITTTVSSNMLDVNGSVITEVKLERLIGKNQEIRASFVNLPKIQERIFAVLVDEIAGGVIDAKYVNSWSVDFSNIPEYIKIPGIHLYKQNPDDPDFLLRKENFIASTSYLMPYGKKINNNGGYVDNCQLTACRGNGTQYGDAIPKAKLYTTTVPDVYSFAVPADLLAKIGQSGLTAKDIFAIVIADDVNGDPISLHPVVATDYGESESDPAYLCRFEFLLPKGVTKLQVHLYKKALYEENFLCKFLGDILKLPARVYDLP